MEVVVRVSGILKVCPEFEFNTNKYKYWIHGIDIHKSINSRPDAQSRTNRIKLEI